MYGVVLCLATHNFKDLVLGTSLSICALIRFLPPPAVVETGSAGAHQ